MFQLFMLKIKEKGRFDESFMICFQLFVKKEFYKVVFESQIGYSQSALLFAHNLIKEVPTHCFLSGGLEAGDFFDKVKIMIKKIGIDAYKLTYNLIKAKRRF